MADDIACSYVYENLKTDPTIYTAEIKNETFKTVKFKDYKKYLREVVAPYLILEIEKKNMQLSNETL